LVAQAAQRKFQYLLTTASRPSRKMLGASPFVLESSSFTAAAGSQFAAVVRR